MLLTMVVRSGQHGFTTQLEVPALADAMPTLLQSEAFRQFAVGRLPSTPPLSPSDVFLFIPMEGLENAWLAQGGRGGQYFTVILVRTCRQAG
jgi:hypothetical protein